MVRMSHAARTAGFAVFQHSPYYGRSPVGEAHVRDAFRVTAGSPAIRSDRIHIALARTIQLEAITDAHHALLSAMAATHPDPAALREEWRRISSMIVASSQIRPPDDAAMEIRAEQTEAQVRMISEILDSLASESEE
jgi:hypothetical protein